MSAATLLARLHAHGIELRGEGDTLRYRPAGALTPALLAAMQGCKYGLLALLAADDPAVTWRVAMMNQRHALIPGKVLPFLTVRDVPRGKRGCRSCGEPCARLAEGLAVRCELCALAAQLLADDLASAEGPL